MNLRNLALFGCVALASLGPFSKPAMAQFFGGPTRKVVTATADPATCNVGDVLFRTDLAAGSNLKGCTSANTWTALGGSGGGSSLSGTTTVSYSATPTFTVPSATAVAVSFKITLTGNVSSSTLASAADGQLISFQVCQDGTGGRSFAWPANVVGGMTISSTRNSTASTCYGQTFLYDGTNARAQGPGGPELVTDGEAEVEFLNGGVGVQNAVVPRLGAANTFTGRNNFTGATKPRSGTAAPSSSDCDESAEYGDVYIEYDQTAGRLIHICTASGWDQQGGSSSIGIPHTYGMSTTIGAGPDNIQWTSLGTTFATSENTRQVVMSKTGTMSRFQIRISQTQSATGQFACTVRKNGANTSITFTVAASSAIGIYGDTTNTADFTQGDLFALQCENDATSSSANFASISFIYTVTP